MPFGDVDPRSPAKPAGSVLSSSRRDGLARHEPLVAGGSEPSVVDACDDLSPGAPRGHMLRSRPKSARRPRISGHRRRPAFVPAAGSVLTRSSHEPAGRPSSAWGPRSCVGRVYSQSRVRPSREAAGLPEPGHRLHSDRLRATSAAEEHVPGRFRWRRPLRGHRVTCVHGVPEDDCQVPSPWRSAAARGRGSAAARRPTDRRVA
jgi:hypothetical protein